MFVNIGFILTIFDVIVVNGSIPWSTIENNLNELIKLYKVFLDQFPSISAHQAHEIRCRSVTIINVLQMNTKIFLHYLLIIILMKNIS